MTCFIANGKRTQRLILEALGDDVDDEDDDDDEEEDEKKRSVPDLLEKGDLGHFSPGCRPPQRTTSSRKVTSFSAITSRTPLATHAPRRCAVAARRSAKGTLK